MNADEVRRVRWEQLVGQSSQSDTANQSGQSGQSGSPPQSSVAPSGIQQSGTDAYWTEVRRHMEQLRGARQASSSAVASGSAVANTPVFQEPSLGNMVVPGAPLASVPRQQAMIANFGAEPSDVEVLLAIRQLFDNLEPNTFASARMIANHLGVQKKQVNRVLFRDMKLEMMKVEVVGQDGRRGQEIQSFWRRI